VKAALNVWFFKLKYSPEKWRVDEKQGIIM